MSDRSAPAAIAPVGLGCCREPDRCMLCNPPPPWPTPEWVAALIVHYGPECSVGFYGGPPPTAELVDALAGRPFGLRVRPDLLPRAGAAALVERGATHVELDALTFDDAALKAAGRRYGGARVREMVSGLRGYGVRVGVVLAPGLPGTSHDVALRDAEEAARTFDTVRIHPVLVLDDSGLRRWHLDGRYAPLDLGEAITTCRAMIEVVEAAGKDVIRVGMQPGPDGLGRAVAGPRHSSLRELIEARRTLDRLRAILDGTPPGRHIVVRCAPADQTRTRGPLNCNVRTLRAALGARSLAVVPDRGLVRGEWRFDLITERPEP